MSKEELLVACKFQRKAQKTAEAYMNKTMDNLTRTTTALENTTAIIGSMKQPRGDTTPPPPPSLSESYRVIELLLGELTHLG